MILGDCLEVLPTLGRGHAHLTFGDLPYSVTSLAWDRAIPLGRLWPALLPCQAPHAATVLTAVQPFTSRLVLSQPELFRHELCWERHQGRGFFNAKRAPLRKHENVLVFGRGPLTYNPLMREAARPVNHSGAKAYSGLYGDVQHPGRRIYRQLYPTTLIRFPEGDLRHDTLNGHVSHRLHPTQKPLALLDWLVRTYSNPGEEVLDPVAGSGTTAHAALLCGRHATCIEKDPTYFAASVERLRRAVVDGKLDATVELRQ